MATISPHQSIPGAYTLHDELWLPRRIDEVFEFFADAYRLEDITPPWLHFQVQTPKPVPMFPGALIDYKLRLHAVPIRWQTEISEWEPPYRFVDRQLKGPYRLWRHLHTFEARDGGTQVCDHVEYSAVGGWLVNRLFVRPDLERIFAYRHQKMLEFLGQPNEASAAVEITR